jgi:hypothetical protein
MPPPGRRNGCPVRAQVGQQKPVEAVPVVYPRPQEGLHLRRIEESYLPIRGSYYGHRSVGVDARAMFEETNRAELGETLDTLRQLLGGLRFLYDNGIMPEVDVPGTKALDLTSRRYFRDVVRAVAGREL